MNDPSPSAAYPVIRFLVARGRVMAYALAALVLLAFVLGGFLSGQWWLSAVGLVAAAILLGLLLSYVELMQIISDTLIPKY